MRTSSSSCAISCATSSRASASPSPTCASRARTSSSTCLAWRSVGGVRPLKVSGIVELRPVLQCQAGSLGDTSTSVPGSSVPDREQPAVGDDRPERQRGSDQRPASPGAPGRCSAPGCRRSSPPRPTARRRQRRPPRRRHPRPRRPDRSSGRHCRPRPSPSTPPRPTPRGRTSCRPTALRSASWGRRAAPVRSSSAAAPGGLDQTQRWIVTVDLRDDGQVTWRRARPAVLQRDGDVPVASAGDRARRRDPVRPPCRRPTSRHGPDLGAFSESASASLARVLNRGAFPGHGRAADVETVSPTAGRGALEAAVIAGLIGVAIMLIVMAYYRRLSVVIFGGLAVWGLTVFTAASFVSNQWNCALTLAGATGIIVSVGVTVDSYVVYFERMRDETRHGRSLRSRRGASPASGARSSPPTWSHCSPRSCCSG